MFEFHYCVLLHVRTCTYRYYQVCSQYFSFCFCSFPVLGQASIIDVVVRIPHKQHNAIIGPKGKLIRSVMDDCGGVRIHFPSGYVDTCFISSFYFL